MIIKFKVFMTLWVLFVMGGSPCLVLAELSSRLEEKSKYEKVLEQKVEQVLKEILGPGKAKVVINLDMDLSSREKYRVDHSSVAGGSKWAWENASEDAFLMPGFAVPGQKRSSAPRNQKMERTIELPSQIIKKMVVTVVVDEDVPEEARNSIEQTISTVLSLKLIRGDSISVVTAPFNSPLQNILGTEDSLRSVIKYGSIALIILICLITLAYCAVKLANAMVLSSSGRQVQEIAMDISAQGRQTTTQFGIGLNQEIPLEYNRKFLENGSGDFPEEEKSLERLEFKKMDFSKYGRYLPTLLNTEPSEKIAVILKSLPEQIMSQVISGLDPSKQTEVVLLMAQTPLQNGSEDSQKLLKELVETRIDPMLTLVKVLLRCTDPVKEKILGELQVKDKNLAQAVESILVRFEQVEMLDQRDLNILLNAVSAEQFGSALEGMPQEFIENIRSKLPQETWKMVHEYMRLSDSKDPAAVGEVRASIAEKLYHLREEGKISMNPKTR